MTPAGGAADAGPPTQEGASPAPPHPAVVIVDERAERRGPMRSLVDMALGDGTVVAQGPGGPEILASMQRSRADAVILEIERPLERTLERIVAIRAAQPSIAVVVCTFEGDLSVQARVRAAGADAYLVKPVSARELRAAIGSRPSAPLVATSA